jgi:hypothetical protein
VVASSEAMSGSARANTRSIDTRLMMQSRELQMRDDHA